MLSKTDTKYIQSLHHKKFRDAEGVFIAEGTKVVMELLQSQKFVCQKLIGLPQWLHENEGIIRKYYPGMLQEVKDFELEKISALTTSNQVLAVFEKSKEAPVKITGRISLMLDTIQDPGNLGTIIRTADWFGLSGIICSHDTADIYNPKVVQSSMGSLARVNIIYSNLKEWLQTNEKVRVYGATLNGKNINTINGLKEGIIVIGNESKGINAELMQLVDEKITIPKAGKAESLNAAVATGIILSHL